MESIWNAIGNTSYMLLGLTVGLVIAAIMFIPDQVREEKQEP